MRNYSYFLFFFFLAAFTSHAQYTETINSNRPGNSQGAFSVGRQVLQIETAAEYGKDEHALLQTQSDLWGLDYAVRYGLLFEQLEVSLRGSYLNQTVNRIDGTNNPLSEFKNFDSNTFGVKYLVYDPYKYGVGRGVSLYSWKANQGFDWTTLIPAVALYAGVNFSFGENPYLLETQGQFTPQVAVISQNNWGPWVLVTNLIADRIGDVSPTYSGIVTVTHSFSSKFAVFGEFQTLISDIYSDELLRGGFAYLLHPDLQAQISGLVNFKDTPSRWQIAGGFSYRFDWHKQDEFLPTEE